MKQLQLGTNSFRFQNLACTCGVIFKPASTPASLRCMTSQVLKRALRCGTIEVAITWSRDLLLSLHKRAETMVVHKPLQHSGQKKHSLGGSGGHGAGKGGGQDAADVEQKRYAAAVVEFNKATQARRGSKPSVKGAA